MFFSFVILLCFLLPSCAAEEHNRATTIDIQDASVENFQEIIDQFEIIPIVEGKNALISFCKRVETHKGHFYLLDKLDPQESVLLIFDEKGNYLRKIDKQGRGPGEYISIADFEIDPKTGEIYIVDSGNRKILIYTREGNFAREYVVKDWIKNIGIMTCDAGPQIIATSNLSRVTESGEKFDAIRYDANFRVLEKHLPFEELASFGLGNGFLVSSLGKRVGYFKHFSDEIAYFSCSGNLQTLKVIFPKPVLAPHQFYDFLNGQASPSEVVTNVIYFENKAFKLIEYAYDGAKYMYLYNKEKPGRSRLVSLPEKEECQNCRLVKGMTNDSFIYSVEAADLENFARYLSPDLSKCRNLPLIEDIDARDVDSFYLVLVKFRN